MSDKFQYLAEIPGQHCQNYILQFHRKISRRNIILTDSFFLFRAPSEKFSAFRQNFSTRLSKQQYTCPQEHFEEQCFLKLFSILLGRWANNFRLFSIFPTGLSELHYTCLPVKIELKLCSFEGNAFFHLFRTLSKKFLACWQKFFGGFIKTAIYVSIGTLWREKLLFWKIRFFITLGHWANNFRFLVAKISNRLWKLHSKGPENHFQENLFFEKKVLSVSDLERKIFGLLARFYQQICQNCIILDHKKIRENLFWKVFIIVVHFSAKNILFFFRKNQQLSQTPFYVSGRILRGNFLLSTFVTFSNFEHRFFCLPAKTYEQWFQSCILRSHRRILMGFFGKKASVLNHFWTLNGNSSAFLQNIFGRVNKTVFYLSI